MLMFVELPSSYTGDRLRLWLGYDIVYPGQIAPGEMLIFGSFASVPGIIMKRFTLPAEIKTRSCELARVKGQPNCATIVTL